MGNRFVIKRDTLSGTLLIALSVFLWFQTISFPQLDDGHPGPALFPQLIAILLGLLGTYLLIKSLRTNPTPATSQTLSTGRILRFFTGVTLVVTYPLLVTHVHFIPAMAVLILFFGLILNNKPWKAMLTAVLSAGLMYALFTQLLGVPL